MIETEFNTKTEYFKEYQIYEVQNNANQLKQIQFTSISMIAFKSKTLRTKQLPNFFIDKNQGLQIMYRLQWTVEQVKLKNLVQNLSSLWYKNINNYCNQQQVKQMRCLYISRIGNKPHKKIVFNFDPQLIQISNNKLYTIGGKQLIITNLIPSYPQQTNSQIFHQLQNGQILSFYLRDSQNQETICNVIYFHEKKGLFLKTYNQQVNNQSSFISLVKDYSLRFFKTLPKPFLYQTLINGLIGIVFHNQSEFTLVNLNQMTLIQNTKSNLDGWKLNPNKKTIIQCRSDISQPKLNQSIAITIGQGNLIQILTFNIHIQQNIKIKISQSIEYTIDFQKSKLSSYCICYLDTINLLQNYYLAQQGIYYVGYIQSREQTLQCGYISLQTPYINDKILLLQSKICKSHKMDILNDSYSISKLIQPNRYSIKFLMEFYKCQTIDQLATRSITKHQHRDILFKYLNHNKFVQIIFYNNRIHIVRSNSLSIIMKISSFQYFQEFDNTSFIQIFSESLYNKKLQAVRNSNGYPFDQLATSLLLESKNIYQKLKYQQFFQQKQKLRDNVKDHYEQQYFQTGLLQKGQISEETHQIKRKAETYIFTKKYLTNIKQKNVPKKISTKNRSQCTSMSLIKCLLKKKLKDVLYYKLLILKQTYPSFIKDNQSIPIMLKRAQQNHQNHVYIVTILEFFNNLLTKFNFVVGNQLVQKDLLDQFVQLYFQRFYRSHSYNNPNNQHNLKFINLHNGNAINQHNLNMIHEQNLQMIIDKYCRDILALMFHGLIIEDCSNQSRFLIDFELPQNIIPQQIKQLKNKNNVFLQMLMKLNRPHQNYLSTIIVSLFQPLLIHPLHPSLPHKIILSRPLLYCILQLQIQNDDKSNILSSFALNEKAFCLLMIIVLEHDSLNSINYQDFNYFDRKLTLTKDHLMFLLHFVIQNQSIIKHFKELTAQYLFKQILFSSIDLGHINSYQIYPGHINSHQIYLGHINSHQKKTIKAIDHHIIQQMYNKLAIDTNIVDDVFSKFYDQIIVQKQSLFQQINQDYPQTMSNSNYLTLWQLQQIHKLYKKFSFYFHAQSISCIQNQLNLQESMIRIHVFRFNKGIKQLQKLPNDQLKAKYIKILEQCLKVIKNSVKIFKKTYPLLTNFQGKYKQKSLTEDQFLEILSITSPLQKTKWQILNLPIKQSWLNLIQLTFKQNDHVVFLHYNEPNSIIMKILNVIFKEKKYIAQLKNLIELTSQQKVYKIINSNGQLKKLFQRNNQIIKKTILQKKSLNKQQMQHQNKQQMKQNQNQAFQYQPN